tara:strand:- start:64 stop:426 length:363 start_codon:yes stop_codon:yes gene_type:complete
MKTTNISVLLNTPNGKMNYRGRGVVTFPFIVHRPISSWDDMQMDGSLWCISHMASGRQAFKAKTIKDAKRMVEVLGRFDLFLMPECDKFLQLCREQGQEVRNALEDEGWSSVTMRFHPNV